MKSVWRGRALAVASHLLIWVFVAFNYVQHAVWRSPPWSVGVFASSHLLLALFALSWWQVTFSRAQGPPQAWYDSVNPITEVCKRTGVSLPPRARLWDDELVLGFDHFCGWLGVPIGLHNRKFFVLLLLYGSLLTAVGGSLSLHDYLVKSSATPLLPSAGGRGGGEDGHPSLMSSVMVFVSPALFLYSLYSGAGQLRQLSLEVYTTLFDMATCVVLFVFLVYHVRLVLRNGTTIDPITSRWDVGRRANWEQVFGHKAIWWLVPLRGSGPTVDGVNWPERLERI